MSVTEVTLSKFKVTYEEQRPGWDEFGKSIIGTITVEAESVEASYIVAESKLGKYFTAYQSKEVK